ncbi:MAG: TRAP transporter large permease [Lentisphaerae bacterium]|jgi:tripartite ATP-independent transporter DctM subunit|nr:TRAP transporter large permease [Lentisphaerota bacterium]
MSPIELGVLGCIVLVVLLMCSLPVGFVMAVTGVVGYAVVINTQAALSVLSADLFDTLASYSLTVIPLFVFMGQVSFHAGISGRLFNAAYHWLGWIRGGLAMAAVGACAAFGAICGSGPATAATMAAVALPEMRKYGYDARLASGTVAAGGGVGMLIPPSVVFIVYGILTEQSIGKLFIAGVLPGVVVAILFCAVIMIWCTMRPSLAPRTQRYSLREKMRSLSGVVETLVLFTFVMGGMFVGWFTPTEGAAVGAVGSVVIAAVGGNCSWRMLARAAEETVRTSCMVLVIVAGATMFGHFLAVTRIPGELASWLTGLPLPGWMIVVLIMGFYLLAGCFIDALALVMLTVPIFYPVVMELGFDPIWFGVMIVLVTQMGVITPPVGVNVYVVSGISRTIPLQTVFRGSVPFLLALIVAVALLILFPGMATYLPGLVH